VDREASAASVIAERVGQDEAVASKAAAEADAIKQKC
jgi:dynein heavy chain